MYKKLANGMQFRLNKINKVKYNFFAKICEKETISKTISKYIIAFDFIDKVLSL